MARVSENSSFHAINYSVGKSKQKLENLQLQGSNLKRIQKPSDDPVGNTELMSIKSRKVDQEQYLRNSSFAKTQLTFTESAVEELTDLMVKAKELAIGQANSFYEYDVRESVAKEVAQLYKQSLSVANRRLGSRYIFSGFKTLTRPFDEKGSYRGDDNSTSIEVNKDFFVPINFSGKSVFYESTDTTARDDDPLKNVPLNTKPKIDRSLASIDESQDELLELNPENSEAQRDFTPEVSPERASLFEVLKRLENGLLSNNHEVIQSILPEIDGHLQRLIQLRTTIGSINNSIDNAVDNIEKTKIFNAEYQSNIEDADVAALFTDLTRQQNVLNATYKASTQLMNSKLIDHLR